MTSADILYRAIRDLVQDLEEERGTSSFLGAFSRAPHPGDIVVTHNVCTVDEDWIKHIERGLVYIGWAIEEDRQFIRSNGEVQPIEKVRHVSKESVQHLSRHSDFLPKDQKPNVDIVPNKLYTVERLNDYAVYENRFLYVLLLRIRDFVNVRYEAIMRAYRAYRGEYSVEKQVITGTRKFTYELHFTDEQDDVLSAPADESCARDIERMDKIRQSVAFFLRTPLMIEVARADKLKSKITKTNVLRMDKNFHEALVLYEYLLAYEKDGYTIEERVEKLDPIPDFVAKELAIPALLSSFLVYEHGLKLEGYLNSEYEKEETRREEAAKDAFAREIRALKRRIEETGEGVEQYMLMLEHQNAALEKDRKALQEARAEIERLNAEAERLQAQIEMLREEIASLNAEIERLKEEMRRAEEEHRRQMEEQRQRYEAQIEALKAAHEAELAHIKEAHRAEIESLKEAHRAEVESLKAAHEEEVSRIRAAQAAELARLKEAQAAELARLKESQRQQVEALKAAQAEELARLERRYGEERDRMRASFESTLRAKESELTARMEEGARKEGELADTQKKLAVMTQKCEVIGAELTAVRKEHGLLTSADDFTTEEGFTRLEHEFEVLGRLVRDEWIEVKKLLRKEFRDDIRATMHKKKAQKSKQYEALREDIAAIKRAESEEEKPVQAEGVKEKEEEDGE